MPTFSDVPIGTSDPISLAQGLALLPTGTARAAVTGGGKSEDLFSKNVTIVAWQFNASASYSYFFGVAGPAVAFLWDTDVTTAPSSLGRGEVGLAVNSDTTQAGFVVGANFGGEVDISTAVWKPTHWYSPWKGSWQSSWTASFKFSFDIINLIISLIVFLLGENNKKDTLLEKIGGTTSDALTSSWGMFDEARNQLVAGNGTVNTDPTFTLPINLVSLTKTLPPPGDALFLANEALDKLGGWISFGPTIGLEVPVALTLESIFVDDVTLDNLAYSGNAINASGGTPLSDNPQTIGVNVSHTAGFTLGFGLFFSVGLLKVFSLNLNTSPVDFFDLLGLPNPVPTTSLKGSVVSDLSGGIIEPVKVSLQLPASATAGSSVTGTVSLDSALTVDRKIALTADDAAANVPAFVTVPAGQTFASFSFTPGNSCSGSGEPPGPGSSYMVNVFAASDVAPNPSASLVVSNKPLRLDFRVTDITLSSGVTTYQGFILLPWDTPEDLWVTLDFLDFEHNPSRNSALIDQGPTLGYQPFPGRIRVVKGLSGAPVRVQFLRGGDPGNAFGFYLTADGGCDFGQNEIEFRVTQ